MIIRSQDKKMLVNFTNAASIYVDGRNTVAVMFPAVSDDCLWDALGRYSTEEKAVKVLDAIQEMYKQYTCRYGGDHSDDAAFQMPQEEDVTE